MKISHFSGKFYTSADGENVTLYIGLAKKDGTEVVPPVWYDCVYYDKTGCFMVRRGADTLWEKTGITIQE